MQLQSFTVEGKSPGPHLLITGGVHGDEFEPMAAARQLRKILIPERLRGRVTLIPIVNEPAFRRGMRTADDGLDLARTCPGREDGSVTEQIAFALAKWIRSADYYIDLHTGGMRLQVQPLVGYMLHPNAEVLTMQRRMAQVFGLPIIWGTDATLQGRSLSVARDANVPALYTEYLGGGGCSLEGVAAYVRGCLNVMSLLQMIDVPMVPAETEPLLVEDHRTGSGHMQVNLPAPFEGFFQPMVSLGQQVESGALLGTVSDSLGDRVESIHAPHAGIVLVLHTYASVVAGECLGVIMDTNPGVVR